MTMELTRLTQRVIKLENEKSGLLKQLKEAKDMAIRNKTDIERINLILGAYKDLHDRVDHVEKSMTNINIINSKPKKSLLDRILGK